MAPRLWSETREERGAIKLNVSARMLAGQPASLNYRLVNPCLGIGRASFKHVQERLTMTKTLGVVSALLCLGGAALADTTTTTCQSSGHWRNRSTTCDTTRVESAPSREEVPYSNAPRLRPEPAETNNFCARGFRIAPGGR